MLKSLENLNSVSNLLQKNLEMQNLGIIKKL